MDALSLLSGASTSPLLGVDPQTQSAFDALQHKAMMQSIFPALLALGGSMMMSPRIMGRTSAIGSGLAAGGEAYQSAYQNNLNSQLSLAQMAAAQRSKYIDQALRAFNANANQQRADAATSRADSASTLANLKVTEAQGEKTFGQHLAEKANDPAFVKANPQLASAYQDVAAGLAAGLPLNSIAAWTKIPANLQQQAINDFKVNKLMPAQLAGTQARTAEANSATAKNQAEMAGTMPARPKAPETDVETQKRQLSNRGNLLRQYMSQKAIAIPAGMDPMTYMALNPKLQKAFDANDFNNFVNQMGYDPVTFEARTIQNIDPLKGASITGGEAAPAPAATAPAGTPTLTKEDTDTIKRVHALETAATPDAMRAAGVKSTSQAIKYLTDHGMSRDAAIQWIRENHAAV